MTDTTSIDLTFACTYLAWGFYIKEASMSTKWSLKDRVYHGRFLLASCMEMNEPIVEHGGMAPKMRLSSNIYGQ